jgi:hypothetical protein
MCGKGSESVLYEEAVAAEEGPSYFAKVFQQENASMYKCMTAALLAAVVVPIG